MNRSNRSSSWHLASSPFTIIIILIVIALLVKAVWGIYGKSHLASLKYDEAQAELRKLEAQKEDLSNKVDRLSTASGVEAEIRTKYRAVRNGESVAVIIDDISGQNQSTTTVATSTSWWQSVLQFIGL